MTPPSQISPPRTAAAGARRASWLAPTPPTVAIEIASRRVTVVELSGGRGRPAIGAFASEALPDTAVMPGLVGQNIANAEEVGEAIRKACGRAGITSLRHAALVVPDAVARVSLLTFEQLPAKAADLDQLVRWQLRKSAPFPLEDAKVEHMRANAHGGGVTLATVIARRDVLSQYEAAAAVAGARAGIVDIASFNVMNAVIAAGAPPSDWLLVCLAHEGTSMAILRGDELLFYRHRAAIDEEPLSALVHQTAMYHEDRLGGSAFGRVLLCGAALTASATDAARAEIAERVGLAAEIVDVRQSVDLRDRITPAPDTLDALAAPVGVLMRERAA